jgi:hypothetical protein
MEKKIVYFEELGRVNTEEALRLAKERGEELGIQRFVVASTFGPTAARTLEVFEGSNVKFIFVGHESKDFPADLRKRIEDMGHSVAFMHDQDPEIPGVVENAYRKLCEGMKVTIQCVAVAVDAGLLPEGEEVVAVAGTGPVAFPPGGGADTAIVMEAVGGVDYGEDYKLPEKPYRRKILEIICMPR